MIENARFMLVCMHRNLPDEQLKCTFNDGKNKKRCMHLNVSNGVFCHSWRANQHYRKLFSKEKTCDAYGNYEGLFPDACSPTL
jgi:hypothetical protein